MQVKVTGCFMSFKDSYGILKLLSEELNDNQIKKNLDKKNKVKYEKNTRQHQKFLGSFVDLILNRKIVVEHFLWLETDPIDHIYEKFWEWKIDKVLP